MWAKRGFSRGAIAKGFGVTRGHIGKILRGEVWSSLQLAEA
jgi:hypothetical protein